MKVKEYYSDWTDNGCWIECRNCGAMHTSDCTCFEIVEVIKCKCEFVDSDVPSTKMCKECTRFIGEEVK